MGIFVVGAIAVFAIGVWIGIGAPGWPYSEGSGRRHTEKRSLNPVAWGRTPDRERQRPRTPGERRIRLR